jgi:hypothetical protein
MMFSRKKNREQSNFSEFIEQKTRLFHSKVVYALHGEHEHYFSKRDVLRSNFGTRCKVCGILLSEYRTQKRFEKMNTPVLLAGEKKAGRSSVSLRKFPQMPASIQSGSHLK